MSQTLADLTPYPSGLYDFLKQLHREKHNGALYLTTNNNGTIRNLNIPSDSGSLKILHSSENLAKHSSRAEDRLHSSAHCCRPKKIV